MSENQEIVKGQGWTLAILFWQHPDDLSDFQVHGLCIHRLDIQIHLFDVSFTSM